MLKNDIHLYRYRLQAVGKFHDADYPVCVEYCRWFLNTLNENSLQVSSLMRPGFI
ncbi:hypothetical protein BDFB_012855 [Asbolus verrucosus]|uniref:Uncharacterized protein n=1 Tax=Asbolus verrucosus TaxID=1661398 RepID=A0A482W3E1_ASBVE|nr:hypothetical protein BDFB_012855 [Asbolus verrucosus]